MHSHTHYTMEHILSSIHNCQICKDYLPNLPKPILSVSKNSKIILIGQAPWRKVHESLIPWDDRSGDTLRRWLWVTSDEFYNTDIFSIVPMGFCYPGRWVSGDLPPRPECAPAWHQKIFDELPRVELIILIGEYAQNYYLDNPEGLNLTQRVRNYSQFWENYFPIVHPSPLNFRWQAKNPWFQKEVVPILAQRVRSIINLWN